MMRSPNVWIRGAKSSASGVSASLKSVWRDWKNVPDRVAPGLFPPELVVQVKPLACELPTTHGLPLSRWSVSELTHHVCQSGLVAQLSHSVAMASRRCDSPLAASL